MTPTSKGGPPPAWRTLRNLSLYLGMEFAVWPHGGASLPLPMPATPHVCPTPVRSRPQANLYACHMPQASRAVPPALRGAPLDASFTPQHLRQGVFPRDLHGLEDCGVLGHGPACSSPSKGAATVTCAEGRTCVSEPHTVPTRGAWSRTREGARRDHEHSMSSVHGVLSPAPRLENIPKT